MMWLILVFCLTPANQTAFVSRMAGKAQFQAENYDSTHLWDTDIPAMIAQAAPAATQAQKQNYQNSFSTAPPTARITPQKPRSPLKIS
jgi:hypothetical protein